MESERIPGGEAEGGGAVETQVATGTGPGARPERSSSERAYSMAGTTTDTFIEPDSLSNTDEENSADDGISTQSLTNSVWTFQKENGRTYHGYKSGTYHFPNDANENDRLDFQHCLFHELFDGRLHFAPIRDDGFILDIGTGTGAWAIAMGDKYPKATIEGTDLSPVQPTAVPENVHFIIDDAESPDWAVPPNHYEFIHTREMIGSFTNFRDIIVQSFKHLKPGGWMESHEVHPTPYCDDGTMPSDWMFKEWINHCDEAAMMQDRPIRIANKMKRWYLEAGFVDIQEKTYKLPLNSWPRDPELKALGIWWQENMLLGLQGFSLAFFSRAFGWSKNEIEVYLVDVRKALWDRHVHAYQKLYVVWGRKPFPHEVAQSQASTATAVVPSEIPLPSSPTQSQPPPQFETQFPPPGPQTDPSWPPVPSIPFDFTPASQTQYPVESPPSRQHPIH